MNRFIDIDNNHILFKRDNMYYKEFSSDYSLIRFYTHLIMQKAPLEIKEELILEQQISELIKNAVQHGNGCDVMKKVKVWFSFSDSNVRLIVEDEGDGFADIEKWNKFQEERIKAFSSCDFSKMNEYAVFKTERSGKHDGGNALFAAVQYWDAGFVFNSKRNSVAVGKNILTRGESCFIPA
jgi:hypothetical protein